MKKLLNARSHLRAAGDAYKRIMAAATLDDFEKEYAVLLSSFRSFYASIEQHAKWSKELTDWWSRVKSENKIDPLYLYMLGARNLTNHGGSPPFGFKIEAPVENGLTLLSESGLAYDLSPALDDPRIVFKASMRQFSCRDGRSAEKTYFVPSTYQENQAIDDNLRPALRDTVKRMEEVYAVAAALSSIKVNPFRSI